MRDLTSRHAPRTFAIVIALALLAAIPRVEVALAADLGIDEPTYVITGQTYVRLFEARDFANADWLHNSEHPAVGKLIIGTSALAAQKYLAVDPILGGRAAAVACGVLSVELLYLLGRRIFGGQVALLAASWLALSPWHVYWSSLALLDVFLVLFLEMAFLLVLGGKRNPYLILLAAGCFALAFSTKYSGGFALPGLVLFGFDSLRPRSLSAWIVAAVCPVVAAIVVVGVNPQDWVDPVARLSASISWQMQHASRGHVSYYAGQVMTHTPLWIAAYVVVAKNSVIALGFTGAALLAAVLRKEKAGMSSVGVRVASLWFAVMLGGFSLMSIAPSDSYFVPLAIPLAICGAAGVKVVGGVLSANLGIKRGAIGSGLALLYLTPQIAGLVQFPTAVGFTNEFLRPGSQFMPVAVTGYVKAVTWIARQEAGTRVAAPVFPDGLRWAESRTRQSSLPVVSPAGEADYLVVPAFYAQDQLAPRDLLTNFEQVAVLGEGGTPYAYVYVRRQLHSSTQPKSSSSTH